MREHSLELVHPPKEIPIAPETRLQGRGGHVRADSRKQQPVGGRGAGADSRVKAGADKGSSDKRRADVPHPPRTLPSAGAQTPRAPGGTSQRTGGRKRLLLAGRRRYQSHSIKKIGEGLGGGGTESS